MEPMAAEDRNSGDDVPQLVDATATGVGNDHGDRTIRWYGSADDGAKKQLLDDLAAQAGGSPRALETLLIIVAHHHLAMPAIHRLVADRDRAEDIEQEVLIAVARSVAGFRAEASFRTWLNTVARNVTIDAIRRSRDQAPLTAVENRPDRNTGLSSIVATSATVRAAVDQLPPTYRRPIIMRDLERLSYQEIADQLGLKLNTLRSRILRGRALLAATLEVGPGEADDLG